MDVFMKNNPDSIGQDISFVFKGKIIEGKLISYTGADGADHIRLADNKGLFPFDEITNIKIGKDAAPQPGGGKRKSRRNRKSKKTKKTKKSKKSKKTKKSTRRKR